MFTVIMCQLSLHELFSGQMQYFDYGDKYSPFLYDSVLLYAIALNETISKNLDPRSGVDVAKGMRRKMFRG